MSEKTGASPIALFAFANASVPIKPTSVTISGLRIRNFGRCDPISRTVPGPKRMLVGKANAAVILAKIPQRDFVDIPTNGENNARRAAPGVDPPVAGVPLPRERHGGIPAQPRARARGRAK